MSNQGLSLILLLFVCFFEESLCICDGTIWTKVGWEIFPEEVHYLKVKPSPARCLPYPLDKLFCSFANMDVFHSCLHLTYILVQTLFLILFVLSVHYLWTKWKRYKKKLQKQASLDKFGNEMESSSVYDIDQILCKLLATTSMMTKYLKQRKKLKSREAKKLIKGVQRINDGHKASTQAI